MVNKQLLIMQMMDTTFPIGLFNQSYGFEYFVYQEKITTAENFYHWLRTYVENQLQYNDLLVVKEIYSNLITSESFPIKSLIFYNDLLHAQNLASEVRKGNSRTGNQFLNLMTKLFDNEVIHQLRNEFISHHVNPHPAMVYAVIGYMLKVPLPELLETYLYGVISSLMQNAVRGIPIGQLKAQKMLIDMHDEIASIVQRVMKLDISEFGKCLPEMEIAQMQHETLFARMFMS
ncbi:MAG: hypothetical protein LKI94_00910 [Sporolactobacillus sp.]|jgi:urease accessory protein|nr:hypothetical protein [Sporolactobacillus sp.]MCI1880735.1 hypothetical protein [Sporolactobacillus sp.]